MFLSSINVQVKMTALVTRDEMWEREIGVGELLLPR